ncbi:uncharacterized protein EAF01_004649 [Botrytis porri]|uniref:uncharacterized protein n=1 Tax=Botrytis porri TaxID=87229 RepID=UPI0019017E28|nr:uncharacterized protein EAF01_004649 [Botrytis porri]KAF7907062.1 hypothetical protein EAF01_004649 [Botrytis porri]
MNSLPPPPPPTNPKAPEGAAERLFDEMCDSISVDLRLELSEKSVRILPPSNSTMFSISKQL